MMLTLSLSTGIKHDHLLKQNHLMAEIQHGDHRFACYGFFFEISGQADGVENNFFPILTAEAASSRWRRLYFDFGLFLLLLEESAASAG